MIKIIFLILKKMTLEKLDFDVKNKTDFSKILTSVEMQAKRKILSLIEIQKNWKEFKEFLEEIRRKWI